MPILQADDESAPASYDVRLSCSKLLMEVGRPADAAELLQACAATEPQLIPSIDLS